MKYLNLIFILITFTIVLQAQTIKNDIITTAEIATHTSDLDEISGIVVRFIKENKVVLIQQKNASDRFYAEFYLEKQAFDNFLALIPSLGYLDSKIISTSASYRKKESYVLELEYYQQQKEEYEIELRKTSLGTERYNELWDKIRKFEKEIYAIKDDQLKNQKITDFKVVVTIVDETIDLSNQEISWVNMPGAEYVYFIPEIPITNISAELYTGYSIKYLFTRGKSFAELTTLKESSSQLTNNDRFSELFILSFGQDFYSKYFGRGKNTFFNLYTGYNLGMLFATGAQSEQINYFISPTIGLELFKNKYFIIDTKTEYFVPFKENKNLRGLMFKASFNFVF